MVLQDACMETTNQPNQMKIETSEVKNHNCKAVKLNDKIVGFIYFSTRSKMFECIYQPYGRVPARVTVGIGETDTFENAVSKIIKCHINRKPILTV